eukprot:TRINITY_DN1160_c0_g3_i2.p1 TRINITY_DN1160_c0_g3~~TRINITY_DN1160_c0_g3_i2.p1  ORF type:complete len:367 (-),score=130.47 TRINITY_DN1160_c0_g3_i2:30-1130(-)
MEVTDTDVHGIHWGQYNFDDKCFFLENLTNNKKILRVPLNKITHSQLNNKTEIVLEMDPEKEGDDFLCEMRLFVPAVSDIKADNEKPENAVENSTRRAETLNGEIISRAKIGEFTGEKIVSFQDILLTMPRGKYTIDFYKNLVRFHGSSFDHKIPYKNINRAFLVPLPDDNFSVLVLGLEKPIHQGSTGYPYILIQIRRDIEENVKVNLKPEQIAADYGDALKEEYEGPQHEVITKVLKAMAGISIIIPGDFKTSNGKSAFRCSVKAREGHLFPLAKALLFIPKPVIYIKHDDIIRAEFHRVSGTNQNKLIDLILIQKNGVQHPFVGIQKEELENLKRYFEQRKICLLYTSPSPRDRQKSRMPSSA